MNDHLTIPAPTRVDTRDFDGTGSELIRDPWRAVHDRLREMILAGVLSPGERLVESALAEQFGTSRGPIRTALRELAHSGLVTNIARRGSFVRAMTDDDFEEVFSLWEAIWPLAVTRAVERMDDDDIAELRRLVPLPPDQIDIEHAIAASMTYYRAIFIRAQHGRLLEVWDNLTNQAQFRLVLTSTAEKRRFFGVNPIAAIADAIERRDAKSAIETCFEWTRKMRDMASSATTATAGPATA